MVLERVERFSHRQQARKISGRGGAGSKDLAPPLVYLSVGQGRSSMSYALPKNQEPGCKSRHTIENAYLGPATAPEYTGAPFGYAGGGTFGKGNGENSPVRILKTRDK